jgi:hypothetical protein
MKTGLFFWRIVLDLSRFLRQPGPKTLIDVSILYFTGDPSLALELRITKTCLFHQGWSVSLLFCGFPWLLLQLARF